MLPRLQLFLAIGLIFGTINKVHSAGASRLPAKLMPKVAYFDVGDRSSVTVDSNSRVTELRDLLATASTPRPSLRWQGNCRYEDTASAARGSIFLDGGTCYGKLSGPLCGSTCLKDASAYSIVLVAQYSNYFSEATIMSALGAGPNVKKRIAWRTTDLVTRTIPNGGFVASTEYMDSDAASLPENNELTAFSTSQGYDASASWRVATLVGRPATGDRSRASLLLAPLAGSTGVKQLYSGAAPGLFAPNGTDFVIGCDYMETRPPGNKTNAPLQYQCDPRYPAESYLRARIAAVLIYDRVLGNADVLSILAFYQSRWALPSPPPPLVKRPPPQPSRGPLPFDLMPDVAFFDASDRASLTVNAASGQVLEQRDIMANVERPRPALKWLGDCRYDSAAGGSVLLDGRTCFAKLEPGRLCPDWERTNSGYSVVMVLNTAPAQQKSAALFSSMYAPTDFFDPNKRLVWRPAEILTRPDFLALPPEFDDPNSDEDDENLPSSMAKTTFVFPGIPANTWQLEALVAKPGGAKGTARYYRGGRNDNKTAQVYSGAAPDIISLSGRELFLGCDYMQFEGQAPEYKDEVRCDLTSYLKGRIMAVLVYGRQLSASDVARLHAYYRQSRWIARAMPPSPPPLPPPPPAPPSTSLPASLVPELAYFDASVKRSVVPRADGTVGALLDVLRPNQQRLDWTGGCRYDESAGGGAIVLDGATCYGKMMTDLCGKWELVLNKQESLNFSLVVVMELDDKTSAPPPRPPLAPYWNGDHEVGELDMSGQGILSYGMQDGNYYYFGVPTGHWTTKSTYITADGMQDYNNVDYRMNLPKPVPRGVWTMEVIATSSADPLIVYSRGTAAQAAGNITQVYTEDQWNFPAPDGTEFRVGCTWRNSDINYNCKPGSHLRGRLSAVLVYGRTLTEAEVKALHTYFRQRWTTAAATGSD